MAGIYVHVPFCKSRCDYCDFYSTTFGAEVAAGYVARVCEEMRERKEYFGREHVGGIYFGGGTPTRLTIEQLGRMCDTIFDLFAVDADAEITVEANPDDLTDEYVARLAALPFNRVSMGVQSFDDALLAGIHRRHTAAQAVAAYEKLRRAGFDNISLDLIYALPGQSRAQWEADVTKALALRPDHMSSYALSYESGTPLDRRREAGEITETDEDTYIYMYEFLLDALNAAGYEHYEISNFALPGRRAVLNSMYWNDVPYLGIGPGAHSYDGTCRRSNNPDVKAYMASTGDVPHSLDRLDDDTRYDEMVMTRLRTCEGIDLGEVERRFGRRMSAYLRRNAAAALDGGLLEIYTAQGREMMRLTRKGIFVSNGIMSDLMTE